MKECRAKLYKKYKIAKASNASKKCYDTKCKKYHKARDLIAKKLTQLQTQK